MTSYQGIRMNVPHLHKVTVGLTRMILNQTSETGAELSAMALFSTSESVTAHGRDQAAGLDTLHRAAITTRSRRAATVP